MPGRSVELVATAAHPRPPRCVPLSCALTDVIYGAAHRVVVDGEGVAPRASGWTGGWMDDEERMEDVDGRGSGSASRVGACARATTQLAFPPLIYGHAANRSRSSTKRNNGLQLT